MRSRVLMAALGVVALAALALGRGPSPRPATRRAAPTLPSAAPSEPSASPVDPEEIRDVFRFAREAGAAVSTEAGPGAPAPRPTPSAAAGPRLVGLVRRSGRLLAALASDGEVVLAGPGEPAAGVTVLSVGEDGVRVRRPDGSEATLLLP